LAYDTSCKSGLCVHSPRKASRKVLGTLGQIA
jgi:hypothetical protein